MIKLLRPVLGLAVVAAGLVAVGEPAGAATAPGGTFVAFPAQIRVLSAVTVRAGGTLSVKVDGVGRIPRSGVGSVAVTLTASAASASGGLVAYGTRRPATTNLQFVPGVATTNTAVVPVARGRIHLRNTARRGSVRVSVDVSGYYRSGWASGSNPGVFHALPTARRLTSLRLGAHAAVRLAVGGRAGLPAEPGAAAVTLTVTGAAAGTILAHRPDEPQLNLPVVRFAAGRSVSSFAVLRVVGGATTLANTSSRAVRLTVDVAGWYVIGFAQTAGTFQTLVPSRIWSAAVSSGRSVAIAVAGRGGVPLSGVGAVLAVVHAVAPSRAGDVQAWRYGVRRPRTSAVLQFAAHRSAANEVLIPVSSTGRIALGNASRGRVTLAVDVHGYVPATTLVPPAGSRGRYLSDLTGNMVTDTNLMSSHGCADAQTGSTFVLLDVGAQSITGPELSSAMPGVSLAKTAHTVRYTYTALETLLSDYLAQFAACAGGRAAEIAIGTNNDGAWDPLGPNYYAPATRGTDWANVVEMVAGSAPARLTVTGADDMEPGFAASLSQTQTWKTAYLAKTTHWLVFNGSADGCPVTWTRGGTCENHWTAAGLYALASGTRTRALPQIYFGAQATQWAMIDATGGGRIAFVGALQQPTVTTSLAAGQSWVALTRALSSVTGTPLPRRVVSLLG